MNNLCLIHNPASSSQTSQKVYSFKFSCHTCEFPVRPGGPDKLHYKNNNIQQLLLFLQAGFEYSCALLPTLCKDNVINSSVLDGQRSRG